MFPRLTFPLKLLKPTAIYVVVWALCLADWMWARSSETWRVWPEGIWFALSLPLTAYWIAWSGWLWRMEGDEFVVPPLGGATKSDDAEDRLKAELRTDDSAFLVRRNLVWSVSTIFLWQASVFFADVLDLPATRVGLATWGMWSLYFLGMVWVVWAVERASHFYETRRYERRRREQSEAIEFARAAHRATHDDDVDDERVHNPLDPHAWYFGRRSRKLNQSLTWISAYSVCFSIAFLVFTQIGGCSDIYEMPAGGGQQAQIAQAVKIQKVIKKKFVVNQIGRAHV